MGKDTWYNKKSDFFVVIFVVFVFYFVQFLEFYL